MPRGGKRGAASLRGKRGGRTQNQPGGRRQLGAKDRQTSNSHGFFSLADEARQTSQGGHWDANTSLRQKPVTFVSAGAIEPLKLLDDLVAHTAEDEQKATGDTADEADEVDEVGEVGEGGEVDTPSNVPAASLHCQDSTTDVEDHAADEIIGPDELEQHLQTKLELSTKDSFFIDLKGDPALAPPEPKDHTTSLYPTHPKTVDDEGNSSEEDVILFRGRSRPIQLHGKSDSSKSLPKFKTATYDSKRTAQAEKPAYHKGSTTFHGPAATKPVSRRRQNSRKMQPTDDDELITDYIENMRANGEIDALASEDVRNTRDIGGSADEMIISSEVEPAVISNTDDPSDVAPAGPSVQKEPLKTPISTQVAVEGDSYQSESEIDDETLARLIAGQNLDYSPQPSLREEQSESSSSDSDDDMAAGKPESGGFDVMDWNRPSLRRKKGKAARAQINFDISDSELERTLQVAWKNDRLKKSQRKKQREELRALGMLGKKASQPDDPRVKYPQGMTVDQVSEEMKTFLQGNEPCLNLPPMDTHARKIVHELANKFNIKSKSTGKADQRRPTLYRTGRTLPYTPNTFDQAVARINRRYFPRLDYKGKKPKRVQTGGGNAAASYREGEVVGAAAPELATSNRGRTMLEKMGWSSGTALGALDNKGILQPVAQTMKKSKAGLG